MGLLVSEGPSLPVTSACPIRSDRKCMLWVSLVRELQLLGSQEVDLLCYGAHLVKSQPRLALFLLTFCKSLKNRDLAMAPLLRLTSSLACVPFKVVIYIYIYNDCFICIYCFSFLIKCFTPPSHSLMG